MAADESQAEVTLNGTGTLDSLRRSTRARKVVARENPLPKLDGDTKPSRLSKAAKKGLGAQSTKRGSSVSSPDVPLMPDTPTDAQPRRNPKRQVAPEPVQVPDDLLDQILCPMTNEERAEWQSWIEVESDPAFFTIILRELGVADVAIRELFTLDSLGELPKPVSGLVFLYQYLPEITKDEVTDSDHIWFANQTTSNACATVALLNIVMNAEMIELGPTLQAFKAETAGLGPPLRGHMLTNNAAIRTAHNTFARRLDLLNADLVIDNAVQEAKRTRSTKTSRSRKKNGAGASEVAFHFIAYVPVAGQLWQLDGLQARPVCLGPFDGDWTSSIVPHIEARMLQYETEQVSFNLLALCCDPLGTMRRSLAQTIHCLSIVQEASAGHELPTSMEPQTAPGEQHISADQLALYGLSASDVQDASSPRSEELRHRLKDNQLTDGELARIKQELVAEQKSLAADYTAQQTVDEDVQEAAQGRKHDYTRSVHEWIKKLVDHGILQDLQQQI